ncbi:2-succinyl-5-enolpyruvyl-6-hydroxy-3-cyclohexene-1-carboxylic-acid synthase [Pseudanabaena sp. FACHB-2040]|uniref:2-succinyl-5-enolpyruvyl-6-hydroxy-3- cyclohexene-1-carboxylic-acid synthase n=1 Tax=Pseudanabaena sp. FACHB-2040 TaxID=2692859 RepID=UPI001688D068|nr:2-succinyl-5-enolpyruvyl-6-hydroxy-3-cyclohexene-1-carboxylic-acid synthase [Pseudanabaena sp. FACHB-2040]MBD2256175.1 2-succinyl-5-enolpyruvyl-6-hydroxy-3-cyclohexene-1-carboxylic-acid synthase [Pseudanabaena sp. FACHB-2040]
MKLDFCNTNTLWASVLVETLVRLGLETAVVSPGSRSTPLTVALALHPGVEAVPVLDERSAAFFGLGVAKRTGKPVVLVCTSGTAGANYYPAVIEARESRVPLLLLTADRPPELRDCASGQTIDQQKLFGNFSNGYAELAIPAADLGLLRYLRQTLVQAWRQTLLPVAGPVHLNCPFRDPLAPLEDGSTAAIKEWVDDSFFTGVQFFPLPRTGQGTVPSESPPTDERNTLHPPIPPSPSLSSQGLIIAGPAQPLDAEAYCDAIANLSYHLQWPVLAEGLSPLRNHAAFNPHLITTYDAILRQPDLAAQLVPDQVIQIGPLPTSKTLRQWLEQVDPLRWVVDDGYRNLDPLHGKTVPLASLIELPESIEAATDGNYLKTWLELDFKVRQRLDQTFEKTTDLVESKVAWLLPRTLPAETPLVIANSMPVRDIEWFWSLNDRGIQPYFNRGANGIDGTLSTALGIAHGNQPTVLLTGDLALLHDTNGFLSCPRLRGHLTIVLINNSGGGIFEMLPISKFDPPFEDFFATPQTVNVAKLCAAYSADYERVDDWQTFSQRLGSLPQAGVRVLEVRCDRKTDAPFRQTLLNTLAKFP